MSLRRALPGLEKFAMGLGSLAAAPVQGGALGMAGITQILQAQQAAKARAAEAQAQRDFEATQSEAQRRQSEQNAKIQADWRPETQRIRFEEPNEAYNQRVARAPVSDLHRQITGSPLFNPLGPSSPGNALGMGTPGNMFGGDPTADALRPFMPEQGIRYEENLVPPPLKDPNAGKKPITGANPFEIQRKWVDLLDAKEDQLLLFQRAKEIAERDGISTGEALRVAWKESASDRLRYAYEESEREIRALVNRWNRQPDDTGIRPDDANDWLGRYGMNPIDGAAQAGAVGADGNPVDLGPGWGEGEPEGEEDNTESVLDLDLGDPDVKAAAEEMGLGIGTEAPPAPGAAPAPSPAPGGMRGTAEQALGESFGRLFGLTPSPRVAPPLMAPPQAPPGPPQMPQNFRAEPMPPQVRASPAEPVARGRFADAFALPPGAVATMGVVPDNMVDVGGGFMLEPEAAETLGAVFRSLRPNEQPRIISGFRPSDDISRESFVKKYPKARRPSTQAEAIEEAKAAGRSYAQPGASQHEKGLAIDVDGLTPRAAQLMRRVGWYQPDPEGDPTHWQYQPRKRRQR